MQFVSNLPQRRRNIIDNWSCSEKIVPKHNRTKSLSEASLKKVPNLPPKYNNGKSSSKTTQSSVQCLSSKLGSGDFHNVRPSSAVALGRNDLNTSSLSRRKIIPIMSNDILHDNALQKKLQRMYNSDPPGGKSGCSKTFSFIEGQINQILYKEPSLKKMDSSKSQKHSYCSVTAKEDYVTALELQNLLLRCVLEEPPTQCGQKRHFPDTQVSSILLSSDKTDLKSQSAKLVSQSGTHLTRRRAFPTFSNLKLI